jgi:hypothetical protein
VRRVVTSPADDVLQGLSGNGDGIFDPPAVFVVGSQPSGSNPGSFDKKNGSDLPPPTSAMVAAWTNTRSTRRAKRVRRFRDIAFCRRCLRSDSPRPLCAFAPWGRGRRASERLWRPAILDSATLLYPRERGASRIRRSQAQERHEGACAAVDTLGHLCSALSPLGNVCPRRGSIEPSRERTPALSLLPRRER